MCRQHPSRRNKSTAIAYRGLWKRRISVAHVTQHIKCRPSIWLRNGSAYWAGYQNTRFAGESVIRSVPNYQLNLYLTFCDRLKALVLVKGKFLYFCWYIRPFRINYNKSYSKYSVCFRIILFIELLLGYQTLMTTNYTKTQQVNVNRWYRHIDLISLLIQRYLWVGGQCHGPLFCPRNDPINTV